MPGKPHVDPMLAKSKERTDSHMFNGTCSPCHSLFYVSCQGLFFLFFTPMTIQHYLLLDWNTQWVLFMCEWVIKDQIPPIADTSNNDTCQWGPFSCSSRSHRVTRSQAMCIHVWVYTALGIFTRSPEWQCHGLQGVCVKSAFLFISVQQCFWRLPVHSTWVAITLSTMPASCICSRSCELAALWSSVSKRMF